MQSRKITKAVAASFVLMALSSPSRAQDKPTMNCDVGPVTKIFGGTNWLMYACSDDASLVFFTPKDSKAYPFYFMIYFPPGEKMHKILGEGTGDKATTDKAVKELSALTLAQIQSLRSEAMATGKAKP